MKHQTVDKFFKVSAILFGQLFVDFFGLNYHIIRLYRNELNTFNGKNLFSDFVFETRESILLNFEFQDVKIQKKHLKNIWTIKFICNADLENELLLLLFVHIILNRIFIFSMNLKLQY